MAKEQQKSKYAGIKDARAQRPANYFKPGAHMLARVVKIEEGEDNKGIDLVAAVFSVVHLFGDSAPVHKVGEEMAEIIKRGNVAYMSRLKALAMVLGDYTESDFNDQKYDGEYVEDMLAEDQPAAGLIVEVRTVNVLKKDAASKPEDKREPKDYYTRTDFIRRVPFSEVKDILTDAKLSTEQIARLVPNIEAEIKQEAEADAED